MSSLSFINVFMLLSTSLLARALTIAPIATVTPLVPITVTWLRKTDDPESWVLEKSHALGLGFVTVPSPDDRVGEVVVTFTQTGLKVYWKLMKQYYSFATFTGIMVVPLTSPDPTPTKITPISFNVPLSLMSKPIPPTSSTVTPSFSLTSANSHSLSIPTSSTVTPSFSLTSADSLSIPTNSTVTLQQITYYQYPSSLESTGSVLPSDSPSTGKGQKNTKIPAVVGGSVGAAGFFVLISVFLLCQRRGKRSVHTSNKGAWQIIIPFRWSRYSMDQTLRASAGLDNPLGGGERNDSEVATNGRGDGELDSSSVSVGTARNIRIPAQRQFRTAGWIFNKTKVSSEKRQSSDEQREVFDWTDRDNDERIRDLPTGRTFPAMQENGGRTTNALRHLDSGIRIMQFYKPELARGQRMSQRDNGESRGYDSEVVEDTMGLPPEYSSHRRSRILDFKPAKWGFRIVKACSRVRAGLRINPIYRDVLKKGGEIVVEHSQAR
ncbi:hypothetical protein K435DRAFT_809640 [Dendrothele bispora CBS 962.96]|uniref:Uncharacterized protein n=1 Tax=Dendrothele bispora (strain CBS 962.96) TaxID=1314807 RepID=A0A4S8KXK3_DENBC|nr:hypothetical protein K435DRAFT_809640 [Dendrothele bispora CBS 962.96]